METSGFFNAEILADGSYDRIYMAEQFAKYFSRFIGNGVFITPASQLKVVPKAGEMGVLISIGDAYINGYWYQNDAVVAKKLSNASGANSRIDRIVLRWDSSTRTIYSAVLQGTPAALPEAPAVTRTADIYELALADILIGKAITEIKEENITDLRNNSNLCGYVKGVVDQIDTTDLFSQFTSSFNSWFADLKAKGDARYDDFDKALQQYSAAFDTWFANIKKKGDDRYNEFDQLLDQYSNEFNTWFDTVKGQLDADAATKLTKAVTELQTKTQDLEASLVMKADAILYDKSKSTLYLKSGSKVLSSTEIKSGATITPKPTVNPQIKNDDKKVVITWEDPTDTVIEGSTLSKWEGTKLVMKESGYPTSPDDGTVLVDNTTRDKYKTTGFEKSGLTNDKVYYFALFPYSTDGVYNYDSGNRLLGEPTEGLKIVTFANGTDEEILAMVQAHYANKINISDYWAVGDTRSVALSAMSATGVGESHRAQTVQFVIGGFNHDDLTTPINGHTKAAVTLLQKDCLMDASNASNPVNGGGNKENGYMNSTDTNAGGWKNCARRTWCNNVFFASLPSAWQNMVKTVNKKSGTGGGSNSGTEVTADKIFLPAEIEVFGSTTYSVAGEGTQYQYYKNATANRYKMPKWFSSAVSSVYRERSPYGDNASFFCIVDVRGSADGKSANAAGGVATCLCI